jgi:hypothetical protein
MKTTEKLIVLTILLFVGGSLGVLTERHMSKSRLEVVAVNQGSCANCGAVTRVVISERKGR